jgi:hypothetical protein
MRERGRESGSGSPSPAFGDSSPKRNVSMAPAGIEPDQAHIGVGLEMEVVDVDDVLEGFLG